MKRIHISKLQKRRWVKVNQKGIEQEYIQYRVNLPPEMIDILNLNNSERVTMLVYGDGEEPTIIENI